MYTRVKGGIVVEDAAFNATVGVQPKARTSSSEKGNVDFNPQTLYIYDNNVGPGVMVQASHTTLTNAWVGFRPDGKAAPCGRPERTNPDDYQGWGVLAAGGVHVLGSDMTLGTEDGSQLRTYVGYNSDVGVLVRGKRFTCVNTAIGLNPFGGGNASNGGRGIYLAETAGHSQIGRQGSRTRTWIGWHWNGGIMTLAPNLVVENCALGLNFDGSPAPNFRAIDILSAAGANNRIGSLAEDANLTYIANSISSAIKSHGPYLVIAACAIGFTFNGSVASNGFGLYIEAETLVGAGIVRTHVGGSFNSDIRVSAHTVHAPTKIENVAVGLDFDFKSVSVNGEFLVVFTSAVSDSQQHPGSTRPDAALSESFIGKDGAPFRTLIDAPRKIRQRQVAPDGRYSGCINAVYVDQIILTIVNTQIGFGSPSLDIERGDFSPDVTVLTCPQRGSSLHCGPTSHCKVGIDGSLNKTIILQQLGSRDAIIANYILEMANAIVGIDPGEMPRKRPNHTGSTVSRGNLISIQSVDIAVGYDKATVDIGGVINKTYISDSWGNGLMIESGSVTISNVAIGLAPDGTAVPNLGNYGIHVQSESTGTCLFNGSWISGNAGTGIFIDGSDSTITNCTIGLGFDGQMVRSNMANGISFGQGALRSVLLSTIISGNMLVGVTSAASGLVVGDGCRIGYDHQMKCAGNGGAGLQLLAEDAKIGSAEPSEVSVYVGCNNGVGIDASSGHNTELTNVQIGGDDHPSTAESQQQLIGIILGQDSALRAGSSVCGSGSDGIVVVGKGNTIADSAVCDNDGNGVAVHTAGQVTIISTVISTNVLDGVHSESGGVHLIDTTILNNGGAGVSIDSANAAHRGSSSSAITPNAMSNATFVSNCTIRGNMQNGMLLSSALHATIERSTFAENHQNAGVVLVSTNGTAIKGCNFSNNVQYGIWVQSTSAFTTIGSSVVVGSARSGLRDDGEGTVLAGDNQVDPGANNRQNNACPACTCSSSVATVDGGTDSTAVECTDHALDFGPDFPHIWSNTTVLTLSNVGLTRIQWAALTALQPGLSSLDLSRNPRLRSIPPVSASAGLLKLENLDLSSTDLTDLQNDTFAGFKGLASLDLSNPTKLPGSSNLVVNFTGIITSVQTMFWFNSNCPPGYWAASDQNYAVCTSCPRGTWKPNNGALVSDCKPCTAGTYDHDADPTTRCIAVEKFEVSSFQRADGILRTAPATSALTWGVNLPVNIGAVLQVRATSKGKYTFVAEGLPDGVLIASESAMMAGSPTVGPVDLRGKLVYNVSLLALDDQATGFALLERITITVRHPDTADPENGPHHEPCAHGTAVDTLPFDQIFACNCVGSSWSGLNCSDKRANPWVAIGGVLGAILTLVVSGVAAVAGRRYLIKSKPHSFESALATLAADGIVTMETASSQHDHHGIVASGAAPVIMMGTFTTPDAAASVAEVALRPREIQRSRLSFLQTVGSGSGGVVQSAMINEPGIPAFMCVVKSPLADAPESARDALLHEAALMAQFSKQSSFCLVFILFAREYCWIPCSETSSILSTVALLCIQSKADM